MVNKLLDKRVIEPDEPEPVVDGKEIEAPPSADVLKCK
jgi:hypothetical protein